MDYATAMAKVRAVAPEQPSPDAPLSVRLDKKTKLHDAIVEFLVTRLDAATEALEDRIDEWEEIDDHCRMYIDLTKGKRKGDQTRSTTEKAMPYEYGAVIPITFASLMVRISQELDVFISRDPYIEYSGTGAEDIDAGAVMSAVVSYDLRQMGFPLFMWNALNNAEKYGLSPVFDTFHREYGPKVLQPELTIDQIPESQRNDPEILALTQPKSVWGVRREYVNWQTIDPRLYWPDPDFSVGEVQKDHYGFCGHRCFRNIYWFLEREQEGEGEDGYFNLEYLKGLLNTPRGETRLSGHVNKESSPREKRRRSFKKDPGSLSLDRLEVKLIPAEMGLSPSRRPEIWVFELVEEKVIVNCHKLRNWHGRFSYTVGEVLPDEASFTSPGYGVLSIGLQEYINWLFAAQMEEVSRRLVNKLLMVPEVFNLNDLMDSSPGAPLRTNPVGSELILAGGRSLNEFYSMLEQPMQTSDLTEMANKLWEMMKTVFSTSDPQLARPLPSKRTLGEVQSVVAMGTQRVAMTVQLLEDQLIRALAEKAVALRQQYTSMEQYVRITGSLSEKLGDRLIVRNTDLWGNFDYEPLAGTKPSDPITAANTWLQLLTALRSAPELLQVAAPSIINQIAETLGIRNFEKVIQQSMQKMAAAQPPQVVPDEVVQDQVQRGNFVPMGG